MPHLHVCPKCSRLHNGKGRCSTCARPARQGTSLYNSARWQKLRAIVRARDGACVRCGTTERLSVHHRNGDHTDNRMENLETLCLRCHGETDGGKAAGRFSDKRDPPTPLQHLSDGYPPRRGEVVG